VCWCSVFEALGSWRRCRRALLRGGSCGRSFLIPCGSVPINDQSKHATGVNSLLSSFGTSINDQSEYTTGDEWHTYFRLLAPSVAAQLFGCFVVLDAGPYQMEEGQEVGLYCRWS
jgi:hypothetical protein